jgi:hypothetical protein
MTKEITDHLPKSRPPHSSNFYISAPSPILLGLKMIWNGGGHQSAFISSLQTSSDTMLSFYLGFPALLAAVVSALPYSIGACPDAAQIPTGRGYAAFRHAQGHWGAEDVLGEHGPKVRASSYSSPSGWIVDLMSAISALRECRCRYIDRLHQQVRSPWCRSVSHDATYASSDSS